MNATAFFDRYEIDYTQSLDQKGLGSVYMAKDRETDAKVAVRTIELHPMFDKGETMARYQKAMELSHPVLLPYFDICRFPNEETIQHFVPMPYIEGNNLQQEIPSLSFQQKNEILKSVLEGLLYLHENGTVWQNLRADHILLQQVQDIYIPLFINYGAVSPFPKAYFSNYEYLAPEQLSEQAQEASDRRTDIWAFGVLAFEIFTGQLPFGKKSPQTPNRRIMERIFADELPELFGQIPETYGHIIRKCLQKDPNARWASIEEIETYLQEHPVAKKAAAAREVGMLEALEKMGEDYVEQKPKTDKIPFFERKIKRKPSRPIQWWEPFFWIGLATLVGYLLSKL